MVNANDDAFGERPPLVSSSNGIWKRYGVAGQRRSTTIRTKQWSRKNVEPKTVTIQKANDSCVVPVLLLSSLVPPVVAGGLAGWWLWRAWLQLEALPP